MTEEAGDAVGTGISAPDALEKKRGRKPGSRVKVKGGVIKVRAPRKPKSTHGWFVQFGTLDPITKLITWEPARTLNAKALKTAIPESKVLASTWLAGNNAGMLTYAARIFEVKYQNLDVKLVAQAPKVVL